jgi:hypothetical protein
MSASARPIGGAVRSKLLPPGRLLVFVNARAGWKMAANYFSSTLQLHLDRSGATYETVPWPPKEATLAFESRNPSDFGAVAVVGGDGSVSQVVHAMCRSQAWSLKPIVLLPSGEHNGIASSLGLTTPETTVSALNFGRVVKVPVWEILHDGDVMRLMAGGMQLGLNADVVLSATELKKFMDAFVSIPMIQNKQWWSSLYWLARYQPLVLPYLRMTMSAPSTGPRGADAAKEQAPPVIVERENVPLTVLAAAQATYQHRGYSLTPTARFGTGMSVTLGTALPRLRAYHLLHREAPGANLLLEDGVEAFQNVERLEFELPPSCDRFVLADGEVLTHRTRSTSQEAATQDPLERTMHMPISGRIEVRRSPHTLSFIAV